MISRTGWAAVLALGLSWSGAAALPSVSSCRIEGNRRVASAEVRSLLGLEQGARFDSAITSAGMDALLDRYRRMGRLQARARVDTHGDSSSVAAEVRLDEGPAATVGRIDRVGADFLDWESLRRRLELRPGAAFSPQALERDVARVLGACAEAGRPYAQLRPADFSDSAGAIRLRFVVDEGPQVRLGKFEVEGNLLTSSARVVRRAGLRQGEVYRQSRVDHAVWRLRRLGAFDRVEAGVLAGTSEPTLRYRVREGGTSSAQGALGYSAENHALTGVFDLELQNLGGGRAGRFRLDARGNGVTEYHVGAREPLAFNSPVSVDVALGLHLEDTLYTQSLAQISLAAEIVPYALASLGVEYERVVQTTGDILRDRAVKLSLGLEWDRRDDPRAPTRGILVRLRSRLGSRMLTPRSGEVDSRTSTREDELEIDGFAGLGDPARVLAIRLFARTLGGETHPVPLYRQYTLGGANSLRGYREQQFRGSAVGVLSVESRWLLGGGGYAFLFAEAGFVRQDRPAGSATPFTDLVRPGYGMGLRMASGLGQLGIDYAWGESVSPLGGKIHVSIRSQF